MYDKLAHYNKKFGEAKGILKNNKMPDLPKHKSKAHRVETFDAMEGFGAPMEEEKEEEKPTMTPEQLAAGI